MKPIFLYGAPASGKTTLGKALSARLGRKFVDLDEVIVAHAGRPIGEIFAREGEPAFRRLESQCLREVTQDQVVSLGGGTLLDAANRQFCEGSGTVICLDTPSAEELERRLQSQGGVRPLGNRAIERAAHYSSFCNRIAATMTAGDSLVVVGSGIAQCMLDGFPVACDSHVAALHAPRLPKPIAIVPSGEEHKTPTTIASLWHAFAERGLGRRDVIAAVGGGVTGDLVGFAAATWMRGIAWINVPTTLLAMVDASTGGKTGCDLPEGKNLAGAFHSPRLVVIDTDFLETLPVNLLADGRAEMIKHMVIAGLRGELVAGLPSAAEIAANLNVKVEVVRQDPFETKGLRLLLNCGHTVAHAVEKLTNYRVSHGSAVAIGCVEEARLATVLGLASGDWAEELAAQFAAVGLPTSLPDGLTFERLRLVMKGDKKRHGDSVTFALPCGWGDVRAVDVDLSKEFVR